MSCGSHFDVVVLGGGPAGTSAGITLLQREGISVAIVERSDYAEPLIGESLSPGTRSLLEYLKVWEQFQGEQSLENHGSRAAWGSTRLQGLDYMFTPHGSGWSLDRIRFDRMLANTFQKRGGCLLMKTRFIGCQREPSKVWTIDVQECGKRPRKIFGSYLIDATGRLGLLARRLGAPRTVHDRLVGVGSIGHLPNEASLESAILVEACEYGWWYASPVPGNRVSVILMSDADIVSSRRIANVDRWKQKLSEMEWLPQHLTQAEFEEKPKVFPCFSSCLRQAGGKNWVAVGDAAASHDPLSSSGLPHALGSGIHGAIVAADALFSRGLCLESYQQSIQQDFLQYLRTQWQYYRRETRWPDSVFWKRRTTPIQIDPNSIIENACLFDDESIAELVHLPQRYSRKLLGYCLNGAPAHQVVKDFGTAYLEIPDQQIILGLQELETSGFVRLEVPESFWTGNESDESLK